MKSTMKVDAWRNCTARQEASFWKGRGGGRLIQNFLTSKKKKKNNGQIRENPYPGVGEGVLSLW